MKQFRVRRGQNGVALAISMILLFVMTIVGVTLIGGTVLQERMAGNQRTQTLAFEAASGGIAESLEWGLDRTNWGGTGTCDRGIDGWEGPWMDPPQSFGEAEYSLRVICREDQEARYAMQFADENERIPPQLFVVSEGRVVRNNDVLSTRQIEVRVEDIVGDLGNIDPAIRIEGEPLRFFPNNADGDLEEYRGFLVDGDGGPGVSTSQTDDRDYIVDQIATVVNAPDGRLASYGGSERITTSAGSYPFDTAANLSEFLWRIKAKIDPESTNYDASCAANWVPDNLRAGANNVPNDNRFGVDGCAGGGTLFSDLPLGPDGPLVDGEHAGALTYVTGDLIIGGGERMTGLVIVEGNVCMHGNAEFKGQLIAVGGVVRMNGGGNGRTEGSIFVSDVEPTPSPELDLAWGDSTASFTGGGNHQIKYNCRLIEQQRDMLAGCGLAGDWEPKCTDDGLRDPGVGARLAITSWRENLGWREGTFTSSEPE